jgi:hypothetical protein
VDLKKEHCVSGDYRYECVPTKVGIEKGQVRVGKKQYFEWLEGFTSYKKRIGINLMHVTVSQ